MPAAAGPAPSRLPVLPDHLRGLDGMRRAALRTGGRAWHGARYHGIRARLYLAKAAAWAVVGVLVHRCRADPLVVARRAEPGSGRWPSSPATPASGEACTRTRRTRAAVTAAWSCSPQLVAVALALALM